MLRVPGLRGRGGLLRRRLVAYSTERGLWALALFLLPLASHGATSMPMLLAAIDAVHDDGWSLLHKAVLSGEPLMTKVRRGAQPWAALLLTGWRSHPWAAQSLNGGRSRTVGRSLITDWVPICFDLRGFQ